jgi:hypothetical protein
MALPSLLWKCTDIAVEDVRYVCAAFSIEDLHNGKCNNSVMNLKYVYSVASTRGWRISLIFS